MNKDVRIRGYILKPKWARQQKILGNSDLDHSLVSVHTSQRTQCAYIIMTN